MSRYRFPGYISFLRDAALKTGHPEAEDPARKIVTLSALGNLCAQVGGVDPEQAPAVMAKAAEFRDQLLVAYEAAELMLDAANRALGLHEDPPPGRVTPRRPRKPG